MSASDGTTRIVCACGWLIEAERRTPWTPGDLWPYYRQHWQLAHPTEARDANA